MDAQMGPTQHRSGEFPTNLVVLKELSALGGQAVGRAAGPAGGGERHRFQKTVDIDRSIDRAGGDRENTCGRRGTSQLNWRGYRALHRGPGRSLTSN